MRVDKIHQTLTKISIGFLLFFTVTLHALEVNIQENIPFVEVEVNGKMVKIQRIQDVNNKLTGIYSKTSRPAPPFSIQPFEPIKGVETVSELDVLEYIKTHINHKNGLLIDARMQKWHAQGTIPGAINIPFVLFKNKKSDVFISKIFSILGAKKVNNTWDFLTAKTTMVFDNGPWCEQGVSAMKYLIAWGYPKEKIKYYRGGMQYWKILGLTTLNNKNKN